MVRKVLMCEAGIGWRDNALDEKENRCLMSVRRLKGIEV